MSSRFTIAFLVLAACLHTTGAERTDSREAGGEQASDSGEFPGLSNVLQVSDAVVSGSEPVGATGFESLARRLKVRTIVSVDGATPDVELARRFGLRYVHIPIGYDGIPDQSALMLTRVMREAARPIYVHCHHGKHRGPAAAVIACMAAGQIGPDEARRILETAGTGHEYVGLWRDVAKFSVPPADVSLPELVETSEVAELASVMARIGRWFKTLQQSSDASEIRADEPSVVDPAHAALQIREALHEYGRNSSDFENDDSFRSHLERAERAANALSFAVRSQRFDEFSNRLERLRDSCKACHEEYR